MTAGAWSDAQGYRTLDGTQGYMQLHCCPACSGSAGVVKQGNGMDVSALAVFWAWAWWVTTPSHLL